MLRRRILTFLVLALISALAILGLSACGGGKSEKTEGPNEDDCTHIDSNDDGVCDKPDCNEDFADGCDNHIDANDDGVCDEPGCNENFADGCDNHIDANDDGVCDKPDCNENFADGCDNHIDANDDSVCDKPGCNENFADGCDNHIDANDDGVCDIEGCDKPYDDGADLPPPNILRLVEGGKANFHVVYDSETVSTALMNGIIALIRDMDRYGGVYVTASDDYNTSIIRDCEILVGVVENRDEYSLDYRLVGNKGYMIKVIDDKVVILGGTQESTLVALQIFCSEYLGIGKDGTDYKNLSVDRDLDISVRENYNVKSISVDGVDLSEFKIYYSPFEPDAELAALAFQKAVYDNAGYVLETVNYISGTDRLIRISKTERDVEADAFSVTVSGGDMHVCCQYNNLLERGVNNMIAELLNYEVVGEVRFPADFRYTTSISHYLYYSEFGAVGDGVTDDFEAIKAAHDAANLTGQTVVADHGIYHLGAHDFTIQIKTDVIWTGAEFIIDDSEIQPGTRAASTNVFTVEADTPAVNIKLNGLVALRRGDTNVGMTFDHPYLLYIKCTNKQYIRYGENADAGADQQEIILVDANGNIDESTPLLWDYPVVSTMVGYAVDDRPITITGGTFTTIANKAPREYTYYQRGISIRRSNVTVKEVVHYIEGEGDTGAPYAAFLGVTYANNVLFLDVVYSGHKTYKLSSNVNNSMGTYDISGNNSNAITWRGCTQANDINDTTLWGVMGSNYCKNLTFDGCVLSRFDAHKGMYNTKILNSEIGYVGINAIGAGTLLIENTIINKNSVVNLRSDYGSTWEGDVIIKDVTLNNTGAVTVFSASWYNHYFGYTCYLPANVTIDNLKLKKSATVTVFPYFGNKNIAAATVDGKTNINPVVITENIIIRNNTGGYSFVKSTNTTLFASTKLKEE